MDIKQKVFENYLHKLEHLTLSRMTSIHEIILDNADVANEDFIFVWEEIIQ